MEEHCGGAAVIDTTYLRQVRRTNKHSGEYDMFVCFVAFIISALALLAWAVQRALHEHDKRADFTVRRGLPAPRKQKAPVQRTTSSSASDSEPWQRRRHRKSNDRGYAQPEKMHKAPRVKSQRGESQRCGESVIRLDECDLVVCESFSDLAALACDKLQISGFELLRDKQLMSHLRCKWEDWKQLEEGSRRPLSPLNIIQERHIVKHQEKNWNSGTSLDSISEIQEDVCQWSKCSSTTWQAAASARVQKSSDGTREVSGEIPYRDQREERSGLRKHRKQFDQQPSPPKNDQKPNPVGINIQPLNARDAGVRVWTSPAFELMCRQSEATRE